MSSPKILLLDFTCWCLITLGASGHCHATIYYRGKKEKVYKPMYVKRFDTTGQAEAWATDIEPSITCVKVANHER